MKCFWLRDAIRDSDSLLLIVKYIFDSKSKYEICVQLKKTETKWLYSLVVIQDSICIIFCLQIGYTKPEHYAFWFWTFLQDRKASTSLRDDTDGFLCWEKVFDFLLQLLKQLFNFASAVHATSLSWNIGKWCYDPVDSHDTYKRSMKAAH